MTGGNSEAVPNRKGKRKVTEENSDEAKKVKLSQLTSEPSSSSQPPKKMGKKSLLSQLLTNGKVEADKGFGLFD